jgi:hypothetical protein
MLARGNIVLIAFQLSLVGQPDQRKTDRKKGAIDSSLEVIVPFSIPTNFIRNLSMRGYFSLLLLLGQ